MNNKFYTLNCSSLSWMWLLVFFVITETSCRKDNPDKPVYPTGSDENINTWILDSLKRYYYWNEALPSKPNISVKPQAFFSTVRNSADRFSYFFLPYYT